MNSVVEQQAGGVVGNKSAILSDYQLRMDRSQPRLAIDGPRPPDDRANYPPYATQIVDAQVPSDSGIRIGLRWARNQLTQLCTAIRPYRREIRT